MGTPAQADLRQEDLIDSNVLIDVLKQHPDGLTLARSWVARTCVSVVAVAEVWAGADEEAARRVREMFASFSILPVNVVVAEAAGRYRRQYGPSHGVLLPDALIAATAKVHNLRLVTRDRKHFPMRDIKIWAPY